MLLSVTLSLTILFIILAFRTKSLHKIEVITLIVFISNLLNDAFSMGGLNLGQIKTSDNMGSFLSFIIWCAALIPAITTWMIGMTLSHHTFLWKSVTIILASFVLVVVEFTAEWGGMIEHHQLSIPGLLIFWFLVLLAVLIFQRFYSKLLKGV
jgi:hypothetical protein